VRRADGDGGGLRHRGLFAPHRGGARLERLRPDLAHWLDEAVAAAGHGHDVAPSVRALAERLAQHRDVLRQVVLLDRRVGPERGHQLVLGEHAPAPLDEDDEGVEDLAGQRHGPPLAQQHAPQRV
jgi:hypothetical protein